jgi:DNA mismatch repair protein MutL
MNKGVKGTGKCLNFTCSNHYQVSDIIHLLPDHIANQIAAGEVIQRPASAVKELMENAVDAGATEIRLIINDAGKQLVQVVDNGSGMSETDVRLAFERHATSKISKIEDLFSIRTMGFRGEALASIAAVAQVEVRTKRAADTAGTLLEIENSEVVRQEPVATPEGTSIAMKNLFFNVPARRNFLKSNAAEMRHIVDEFIRVAMAYPDRFFSLTANSQQQFHLEAGTLKQRIVQILGQHYQSKLVSVSENTDYMNISGFIGKPETAKKTRGDQYFFVNRRFIRSAYLNHAVTSAFQDLLPADTFPAYVLFIDLDPAQVDINVHPTKQEIKFEDEKIVYAFVQSAVRHALAQFSITPALDFDLDPAIQHLDSVAKPFTETDKEKASASSLYKTFTEKHVAHKIDSAGNSGLRNWKDVFEAGKQEMLPEQKTFFGGEGRLEGSHHQSSVHSFSDAECMQLFLTYIICQSGDMVYLVHQQRAHERILLEKYQLALEGQTVATQTCLFPTTLQLSPQDTILLNELLPSLQQLGYQIEPFGKDSFVIRGIPADTEQGNERSDVELLLEQYKHFSPSLKLSTRDRLLRSVSKQRSIKAGRKLNKAEMQQLMTDLFQCKHKEVSPSGQPVFTLIDQEFCVKMLGA